MSAMSEASELLAVSTQVGLGAYRLIAETLSPKNIYGTPQQTGDLALSQLQERRERETAS